MRELRDIDAHTFGRQFGMSSKSLLDQHLIAALDKDQFSRALELVRQGADPNIRRDKGWPFIHEMVAADNAEAVALLIERGADATALTAGGWSILHRGGLWGATDALMAVVHRPEVKALLPLANDDGETALHITARRGYFVTLQLLLDAGASRHTTDASGRTPAESALQSETLDKGLRQEVLKVLAGQRPFT
jgi:ankyrin repeat protein